MVVSKGFPTVWLLALVNAIAMSAFPMMMLIGSIIGARLAPGEQWATLPIALMVIGTACGVVPAARGMAIRGRRWTFILFVLIGAGGCLLAGQALAWSSFALFCLSAALLGLTNAALQQIRFAAMESVPLEKGPAAASVVMCAGIVAAFLGPELALLGRHLFAVEYLGSYVFGMACFLAGGLLLLLYAPAPPRGGEHGHGARALGEMLANPLLLLAIASGAVAFVVMSFVMTATPVSMHLHHGHSMEDTKWVIQSHIAAMYLPSLITAWLFRALAIRGLMITGLACYALTVVIGLLDVSVMGFWGQLVMLGIGWNFLFISGTALLPTAHAEGEQYRAQALNDSVVFGTQAIASLSAGWAVSALTWQTVMLLCLLPMGVMAALLAWYRKPI
jgi:MFS family permease